MSYLIDGMANGAAIFSGRAVGAKNGKLFAATVKMTFKWLVVLAAILMLGYHLSNEFFIRLFTNIEEVVAMAMTYNVFVLFYPVCAGIGMVLYGVFCGATRTAPVRNMMLWRSWCFTFCSGSWCRFGVTADCGWHCWALCCLSQ